MAGAVTVDWGSDPNEHGEPMLWLGSWLAGAGFEGAIFYSGRGGNRLAYDPPPSAAGLRIRRWPNEGLDAEYVDLALSEVRDAIDASSLAFEAPSSQRERIHGSVVAAG